MYKKIFFVLYFTISFLLAGCAKKEENGMDAQRKSVAVKTFKIFDSGNVNELDPLVADDAVDHQLDTSMSKKTGLEGIKEMFTVFHSIFPDMKTTIHSMAISGDTLFAYSSGSGTPMKPFMGMPANVKSNFSSIDLFRFEGNKIVEHWGFMDAAEVMKMMRQPMMDNSSMINNKKK